MIVEKIFISLLEIFETKISSLKIQEILLKYFYLNGLMLTGTRKKRKRKKFFSIIIARRPKKKTFGIRKSHDILIAKDMVIYKKRNYKVKNKEKVNLVEVA